MCAGAYRATITQILMLKPNELGLEETPGKADGGKKGFLGVMNDCV